LGVLYALLWVKITSYGACPVCLSVCPSRLTVSTHRDRLLGTRKPPGYRNGRIGPRNSHSQTLTLRPLNLEVCPSEFFPPTPCLLRSAPVGACPADFIPSSWPLLLTFAHSPWLHHTSFPHAYFLCLGLPLPSL
jgi:hypothetical protein